MLTYNLSKSNRLPMYEQLYRYIRDDILSGKIKGESKLPSKRELAAHLCVSKVTVEAAYSLLVAEGYVYSLEKKGYYVESNLTSEYSKNNHQQITENNIEKEYIVDLASNTVPPDKFPFNRWSGIMRKICLDYKQELLSPLPYNGALCLRKAICDYLYEYRGIAVKEDNIIIGAGAEYLYSTVIKALNCKGKIAVEDPTYHKIINSYKSDGLDVRMLEMDKNGVMPDFLYKADCDVIHISPAHNFPTGIVTTPKRRQDILNWLYQNENRYIIEDDFDSELRFGVNPVSSLYSLDKSGRVIYINSFSKTIAPSVRIAYCILPDEISEKYKHLFEKSGCTVSSFEQYTLAEFISKGYFERHINRNRKYYKTLRNRLMDIYNSSAINAKSSLIDSAAGLHFLLKIDTAASDKTLKNKLGKFGIKATFYSEYCSNKNKKEHILLVNYSGLSENNFKIALDKLNELI